MILSATFSKPSDKTEELLGKPYIKIRMVKNNGFLETEFFTEKQSFHKRMTEEEARNFIEENAGSSFKNVTVTTDTQTINYLSNRRGEVKKIVKTNKLLKPENSTPLFNRKKNYIIQEGVAVPFLVKLGVMTAEGKVIAQKYDKFRQINRFLEFIDDIIDDVTKICFPEGGSFSESRPLYIADFGCGKSYLTFAVYHYLKVLKNIPVEITGLDLKKDVIQHCSDLARELNYEGLHFDTGDVAQAEEKYRHNPDIMITLHACDTATDYALDYAVSHNTAAILSVPCCQHEINLQLEKQNQEGTSPFASLEKWGLIRERFAALATDALRGELLEASGYTVQMLEFIDMSHTPKNILIRAVRKNTRQKEDPKISERIKALTEELNCKQTLLSLLQKKQTH